eukprot:15470970-Alexandrium_andersonii.AAC.1
MGRRGTTRLRPGSAADGPSPWCASAAGRPCNRAPRLKSEWPVCASAPTCSTLDLACRCCGDLGTR